MKLTTLMLIIALVQASAAGFSQVKLSAKNASIESVFGTIKKQTGYTFFYNRQDIRDIKVSINVENASLNEVLDKCFSNLPLNYDIKDKTIFVSKKAPTLLDNIKTALAVIDVHGRVVDEKGQPMPGVTIKLKDESQATVTDNFGNFFLKKINEKAVVVISFIGYLTKDVSASEDLGTIALEISSSKLDEVQVQAYGITSRRLSTSNITTVKAEDIAKQPVNNPLLALQGRVPGLIISQSSGLANSGITVRIQGQNSLREGNDPLYVINGVPYTSQLLPGLGAVLGNSGGIGTAPNTNSGNGNPLSFLNPSDIESIDVLKDADATAIYGSKAANGAILITTKKGKAGKTSAEFNVRQGFGQVGHEVQLLNTQQYLAMRHEAKKNINGTISSTDYDINGLWDTTRNTNWQKKLLGGTAAYTDAKATVSGGNANTIFLIGGGYHRETTVFPAKYADQKGSVNFNINNQSSDQKFRIQVSGNYLIDQNNQANSDITSSALSLAPDAPDLFSPSGSINWAVNKSGNSSWTNPLAALFRPYNNTTKSLIANSIISYKLLSNLSLSSSFGYSDIETNEITKSPLNLVAPQNLFSAKRYAYYSNSGINSWIIEPQIKYNTRLGGGDLDILIGSTLQHNSEKLNTYYGEGYNSDLVLDDIRSANIVTSVSSVATVYKYNALFGRVTYNYENKYVLNLNARRDGSSRFGEANLLHNFASIGGAWIFSNEDFIKDRLKVISYGKLRASYGTTGNDQIGNYSFLSLYNSQINGTYQGISTLWPNKLSNPYLQWEETNKLQFGMDLGFFKDRMIAGANYYRNRSSNLLLPYNLPTITGFGSIDVNFPATIQNSGFEFTLNTTNLKGNSFTWTTNFNITLPSNKLLKFPNLVQSPYNSDLTIGKSFTSFKLYKSAGVDPNTGIYQFYDSKGNITTTPDYETDRIITLNINPRYYGGLQNNFSFRSFELDFLFTFAKQIGKNLFYGNSAIPGRFNRNQPATVLQRWVKVGDVTPIQKYSSDFSLTDPFGNANASDAAYQNASYIKLKNVALSYKLSPTFLSRLKLKDVRVFCQAQNVFTITKYIGLDPETLNIGGSLPPLRTITMGLQVTL